MVKQLKGCDQSRMAASDSYYSDVCFVYNTSKIYDEAFSQCSSCSEAALLSPTLFRIALPPLSYSAPLLQSIWSVVAAAAGTVRSACQTEIHVPGMSPGGLSNSVRFIVKSLSL